MKLFPVVDRYAEAKGIPVQRHQANGSDTSGIAAKASFEEAAMFMQFMRNSFLSHSSDSSCWFSTAAFSVTFSFIAAIVIILLPIILRQSAVKNLRSSVKHNPFLDVLSREWLARRNVFLTFMSHLRGMLDDGYRTDCGVKLTQRVRSCMELHYSLYRCCVPFSL